MDFRKPCITFELSNNLKLKKMTNDNKNKAKTAFELGDNELVVNNVALNGLQRMEFAGFYKLTKNISEAKDKKKTPPIGKPHRGGSKKFYVYVRKPGGGVKKVSFGMAGGGLRAKLNNPKARHAFAKRMRCAQAKDRTTARYWSCRLPRYAKLLGMKTSFSGYW